MPSFTAEVYLKRPKDACSSRGRTRTAEGQE
jgi:hypothetical protein